MADWNAALTDWLKPFVKKLGHKKRRQMCPLYVAGLIGPGERKSIEPMAARIAITISRAYVAFRSRSTAAG